MWYTPDEMEFEMFGLLKYLRKENYYTGPWEYDCMALGQDNGVYDIVYNKLTGEYRFTDL